MEKQKYQTTYIAGIISIVLTGLILIWHSRLSFCQSDESFYLALVHRFWCGDRMILDERNVCQFYSPILLPFYALYRLIVPEGTGVYLYARVVYVLFSTIVSVLFYQRCCKNAKSRFLPLVAALLLLLYSRANICGPSYYNLCIQFTIASALFLWKDGNDDHLHKPLLTGVFFALAVLCNPYLSTFAVCGLVIIGINRKTRKWVLSILAGLFLTALIYLSYLMRSGSPMELLNGLANMLNTTLPGDGAASKLKEVNKTMLHYVSFYVFPVTAAGSIITILYWKREKQFGTLIRTLYFILCLLLIGYTALKSKTSICFVITVPFTILIIPAAIRAFLDRENDFALTVYTLGIALAIAFFFASNTGLDAMTTGTCLSSAGGVLLLSDKRKDENCENGNKRTHSFEQVVCICICLVLIGVFSAHRFLGVYRDAPVAQLTHHIESGPAAGLYTTEAHAEVYDCILNEIEKLHEDYPNAGVLFSKNLPWAYLASDWTCADLTVWATRLSDPRIEKYYQTHQEPDIIFVFDESVAGYETAPFNNHLEYNVFNQNEFNGPFYDHLMQKYQVIDKNEILTAYYKAEF